MICNLALGEVYTLLINDISCFNFFSLFNHNRELLGKNSQNLLNPKIFLKEGWNFLKSLLIRLLDNMFYGMDTHSIVYAK